MTPQTLKIIRDLELLLPPQGVTAVVIHHEASADFTGQATAYTLAHLLAEWGFTVSVEEETETSATAMKGASA